MKRTIFSTVLLASFLLIGTSLSSTDDIATLCKAGTFSDDRFTKQNDQFSIYEKVYLLIQCKGLPEGPYALNTQWMDEEGKVHTVRALKFQVDSREDYAASFKFKQMPQGTLKQMISGQDFEDYQFGKWSVLVYINGNPIDRNYFTITN